ncbi:uracil-DNA glycosylase family protein, partial [Acetobacter orientalis]|uniref:uracil-DNA glycosylase family protein n=1 Tax=Acetobacter orientalis TaxID=146474 RepID=UPI000B9A4F16
MTDLFSQARKQTTGTGTGTGTGTLEQDTRAFLQEVRSCQACRHKLPFAPRPVINFAPTARLIIAGQAPGTRVHETGIPFNDASGERLRAWLNMGKDVFYDTKKIAIIPMAFCYPGVLPKGGDKPPPPECATLWRERLLNLLPNAQLTLLVGSYSQNYALGKGKVYERTLDFRKYLPNYFPLPHPSWRTGAWERSTPAFTQDVLPALRSEVQQ